VALACLGPMERQRIGDVAMNDHAAHSRRFTTRIDTPQDVWVYWHSAGRNDVSRVRNISAGGLFLETDARLAVGMKMNLNFLVPEGQIRADAIVRRAGPQGGLGMKFTELRADDRKHLEALLRRSRELAHKAAKDNANLND